MAEQERLTKKKRVRNGNKQFVRKVITESKELVNESPLQITKLQSNKVTLEEKLELLKAIDNEIIELTDDGVEEFIWESSELQAELTACITILKDKLTLKDSESHGTASLQNGNATSGKTKLPKLSLKRFDGNPVEWFAFWDSFNSCVHSNSDLNDVDKFNYLKSLLDGTASDTISGFSLTGDNYNEAVKLLASRFGNKQVIISSHMETLTKMPKLQSQNNVKQLRDLYDRAKSHVRGLENIGISSEMYGCFLTPIIMQKLPEEFRILITRNLTSEPWKLEEILDSYERELRLREQCLFVQSESKPTSNLNPLSKTFSMGKDKRPNTTATLFSGNNKTTLCTFCGEEHRSNKCNTVTHPQARKQILREKGKCFICLRAGHLSRDCHSGIKCFKCNGSHHISICTKNAEGNSFKGSAGNTQPTRTDTSTTSMYVNQSKGSVLLQTALARVVRPDDENYSRNVRIVFDSCSQRTYITDKLKKSLRLPVIGKDSLLIKTFGDSDAKLRNCEIVQLGVKTQDGETVYIKSYVVPVICGPISHPVDITKCEFDHLRGLQLADNPDGNDKISVDVLVGADFYWCLVEGNVIRGNASEPVAIATKLGYVLSGPVLSGHGDVSNSINLTATHVLKVDTNLVQHDPLTQQIKKFWDYESIGIKPDETPVCEKFIEEINFTGERYKVKLPFKESHPMLPDNYKLSNHRLTSQLKRLQIQPAILEQYDKIIKDQLHNGIIEVVSKKTYKAGEVHYLPHHGVIREDRDTSKLRIVYDGSSKTEGPSLNECLYSGPALNPLLFDILIRFRAHKVALTGDIQQAFLNIEVDESQRDFLRFLWVKDVKEKELTVITYRFCRVVFGLTCSPFLLNGTIRHHLSTYGSGEYGLSQDILKFLYVDDYLRSLPSVEEAFSSFLELKQSMSGAGFNMHKWKTNSEELAELIRKTEELNYSEVSQCNSILRDDQTFSKSEFAESHDECVKVLGTHWNVIQDKLYISFSNVLKDFDQTNITKRVILSIIARMYDPLGLISPIIVALKIIFQQVCKSKASWDSPVDQITSNNFCKLMSELQIVQELTVDRQYVRNIENNDIESIQLHGYSDASENAYAACVYIRVQSKDSRVGSALIASKTRVCPLSGETIPRLELLGAVLVSRLVSNVKKALEETLKIERTVCWTDSQVVLHWIHGIHKEYKTFIQNRVVEIRGLTPPECWNYCPSELNPADIASRGTRASILKNNEKWWNGPRYLSLPEYLWPSDQQRDLVNIEENVMVNSVNKHSVLLKTIDDGLFTNSVSKLISVDNYSNIKRLYRITAWVLRFVNNSRSSAHKLSGDLTSQEIKAAECIWILDVQKAMKEEKNYKQLAVSLGLYEDTNGIIRCKGRLGRAPLPFNTRFPIILPRKHKITEMIIHNCHQHVLHNGLKETLNELREKFWVPKGRQTVKKIISRCPTCRRIVGKCYDPPTQPELPSFRLSDDYAFLKCGIDFAGPLYVRNVYGNAREMFKSYIALFTCASSRAIHLELTPDLSSECFLRALKRFQNRRGRPTLIVSDNGKTFKDSTVQNFASAQNTRWNFNLEKSPWWGGFFERLVKSVKLCLKKNLRNARLTFEEMNTVLIEVEGILNSRPLTYLYEDSDTPITPSHLVIGRRILSTSDTDNKAEEVPCDKVQIGRRAVYIQQVLDHFRTRFKREYLTELREHHRLTSKKSIRQIKVGDIVIVHEDKQPRQLWRLARVKQLIESKDGAVRGAEVLVSRKDKNPVILRRPVQRLYPVEVNNDESAEIRSQSEEQDIVKFVSDSDIEQVKIVERKL